MSDVETRCEIEALMVELLEQRGWAVLNATRRGVDLDLDVEYDGQAGKVLFRNGFDPPKGTVAPTSEPCFIRIELGEQTSQLERWALWDHYSFPGGKGEPRYVATVFHEAIGVSWASVAGNAVAPGRNFFYRSTKVLSTLLEHAEALSPTRDEPTRQDHLLSLERYNFGPQRIKHGALLFVILFVTLWVGPVIYSWGQGGLGAALGVAIYVGGFIAFIFAIIGLVALVRRARQPKGPVEGMDAVAESLRAAGAYEVVELTRAKKRDGLPVVKREGGYLFDGAAPLWVSRLTASSSINPITLEADLCRVDWPDGIVSECRFLPDRWLIVELAGSDADLANLPAGPREERRQERVRWLFTGEELDSGRATDLFQSLAAAQGGTSGPYR